jgi:hypothetical protein
MRWFDAFSKFHKIFKSIYYKKYELVFKNFVMNFFYFVCFDA